MDKLDAGEREVHIWLDDIDRIWYAEVSIGKYINKFRKMGWKEEKTYCDKDGKTVMAMFSAPEFAVTIRKPVKRVVSDELKQAASERLSKLRNS